MTSDPVFTNALRAFRATYDAEPEGWVQAPGRVNLIGEHTDYNGGFVLPAAIDRRTLVAWRRRNDAQVRVVAADLQDAQDRFQVDGPGSLPHAEQQPWADYVRGMAQVMREAGHVLPGLDLAVAGDVPQGAGLSSSASLEVATGAAFRQAAGGALDGIDATRLAQLAQRAENQFVGCQCGIMDQLIAARGEAGHALLIDCRSLAARAVPLPPGVAILIVHSQVRRGLVGSEYNTRRAQCEAAAAHYGVPQLRDLSLARLEAGRAGLDDLTFRRARHIVSENQRTLDAAEALARGDLQHMGELMAASHDSMRDDFEITVPAVDRLAEILQQAIGAQGGARMTGGGFGGCVVALLPEALLDHASEAVARDYRSPEGLPGRVFRCRAAAGVGVLR